MPIFCLTDSCYSEFNRPPDERVLELEKASLSSDKLLVALLLLFCTQARTCCSSSCLAISSSVLSPLAAISSSKSTPYLRLPSSIKLCCPLWGKFDEALASQLGWPEVEEVFLLRLCCCLWFGSEFMRPSSSVWAFLNYFVFLLTLRIVTACYLEPVSLVRLFFKLPWFLS